MTPMATVKHLISAPGGTPLTEVRARLRLIVDTEDVGVGYVGVRGVAGDRWDTPDETGILEWSAVDPNRTADGSAAHPDMVPAGAMYGLTLYRRDDGILVELGPEQPFNVRDVSTVEWVGERLDDPPGTLETPAVGVLRQQVEQLATEIEVIADPTQATVGGVLTGTVANTAFVPGATDPLVAAQLEGLDFMEGIPDPGETLQFPSIVRGELTQTDWRDMALYVMGGLCEVTFTASGRIAAGTVAAPVSIDAPDLAHIELPLFNLVGPNPDHWHPTRITQQGTQQVVIKPGSGNSLAWYPGGEVKLQHRQGAMAWAIPITSIGSTVIWGVTGDIEVPLQTLGDPTAAMTWDQRLTFDGVAPRSTVDPSDVNDLARKSYVDSVVGSSATMDTITGPTAAVAWTSGLTIGDGNASHGTIALTPSAFGPGLLLRSVPSHTQPAALLSPTSLSFGDPLSDVAPDWVLQRTAANIASLASGDFIRSATTPVHADDLTRKGYVDSILAAADVVRFVGALDCSSNPNYPAADAGHLYRVSVAGKIGGASGPNVEQGDELICVVDSSASGNHATVGASWIIGQANIDGAVVGPAGATGDHVVLFDGTSGRLIKSAGGTFNALVQANRIDQMVAPTAALNWLSATAFAIGDGTAARGSFSTSTSIFGTFAGVKVNSGDAQFGVGITKDATLLGMPAASTLFFGPGGATAPTAGISWNGTAALLVTGALTSATISATASVAGLTEHATSAETITGTDTTRSVTPAGGAAAYVPKALVDAAGDLLVGTANDTVGRLAAGTAFNFLRTNSAANGLEWATGGRHRIQRTALGASATSITLTPIAGFEHLRMELLLRADGAGTGTEALICSLNSDTTAANYDSQQVSANGGTATSQALLATGNSRRIGTYPLGGVTAGFYSRIVADFLFYGDTNSMKSAIWWCATPRARSETHFIDGQTTWASTSAITSIVLTPSAASNFVAGSIACLYGLA